VLVRETRRLRESCEAFKCFRRLLKYASPIACLLLVELGHTERFWNHNVLK
jgi:hypothetical protein